VRTVYFGTSEFAASVLRRLVSSPHAPRLVVTPPDRPRGRGRRLSPTPAALVAEELGIDVLRTDASERPEALERIRAAEPEIGAVCAFGQLLREPLLSELEMLNVHPSLIPRWRGAAPIERAIMAGDAQTGVTIIRVSAGLDAGPVAIRETVPIAPDDTYGTLAPRLAELGGELLVQALELRGRDELELSEQDEALATYAQKIDRTERRLDPARPAAELERVVRALSPHIGAYLELDGGERLGVLLARAQPDGPAPGELEATDRLRLGCGDGSLRLVEVRPPGGRPMDAGAYLRGHPAPRLRA
jgi:methionyl-tRNA formyltransferase